MSKNKLHVLAHRGNQSGPNQKFENIQQYLLSAVHRGYGVEFDVSTDIRKTTKNYVVSHEPTLHTVDRDFALLLHALPGNLTFGTAPYFLDIKQGVQPSELIHFVKDHGVLERYVFFDYELLSVTNSRTEREALWKQMRVFTDAGVCFAHRVSDKEPFFEDLLHDDSVKILWMDELETEWITYEHIVRAEDMGKKTYLCSPEITPKKANHPESPVHWDDCLISRWLKCISWGVTGICTDYSKLCTEVALHLGR